MAAVNDAPDLEMGVPSMTFEPDGSWVSILAQLTLSDPDSQISSVELRLTGGSNRELRIDPAMLPPGMSALWDSVTSTLTISGVGSSAEYETVLRAVQFFSGAVATDETVELELIVTDAEFQQTQSSMMLMLAAVPPSPPPPPPPPSSPPSSSSEESEAQSGEGSSEPSNEDEPPADGGDGGIAEEPTEDESSDDPGDVVIHDGGSTSPGEVGEDDDGVPVIVDGDESDPDNEVGEPREVDQLVEAGTTRGHIEQAMATVAVVVADVGIGSPLLASTQGSPSFGGLMNSLSAAIGPTATRLVVLSAASAGVVGGVATVWLSAGLLSGRSALAAASNLHGADMLELLKQWNREQRRLHLGQLIRLFTRGGST